RVMSRIEGGGGAGSGSGSGSVTGSETQALRSERSIIPAIVSGAVLDQWISEE
ncbi:MAG: hypothetical protein ACI8RZ_005661, partial [Myxococcota bacterium]